jgi:hypothetical protein
LSAFDFREKDNVIDAIVELAMAEENNGKTTREIIVSILEAVNYGIDTALSEQEQKNILVENR